MRKLILVFVVLTAIVGTINAQPGRGQRMSPEERDKALADTLGLDEAQKAKMSAISAKYQKSFNEMREKMQGADEDARRELFPKMREINDARNKEIRAILNAGQAKKFDEIQKEREERMRNRQMRSPEERGGNTRPGR
jgi:F0F1-type ATP synthase membrane subunit b/b'